MKNKIAQLLCCFFCFFSTSQLQAVAADVPACMKELEMNFFQPAMMMQAFSFYNIPLGSWRPIIDTLQLRSREIPLRLNQVSANLVPNPLEFPFRPRPAARLLRAVLYQVFMETMSAYQANELPTANFIFNYVCSQNVNNWVRCFGDGSEAILYGDNIQNEEY